MEMGGKILENLQSFLPSPPPLTITLPRLLRVGDVVKIFQASLEDFDN